MIHLLKGINKCRPNGWKIEKIEHQTKATSPKNLDANFR